ncbi:MAG: septum formation protein Maf [Armatimonadetes bacterium]|nr:septum formation protein Maf [Armatimonadota bacterium]
MRLLLASNSPRRKELLARAGYQFEVAPQDVDEKPFLSLAPAQEAAIRCAEAKARSAFEACGGVVLAADTVVEIEGDYLDKPVDAPDAARMLRLLSGREHRVTTGVCVWSQKGSDSLAATTRVWFRSLDAELIERYVASGEPMDKAGAYGIQDFGALLVERIDGCYFNVVGLPISKAYDLLGSHGAHPSLVPVP